ncbi:UNVERIFIED_CONTAM: putative late blight resistance proteinR1B-12 [Sesamum radiatum]|uniref:Late blight resistance proteinR1B-12 n=1 Tax=Sesamum radiatum TaxID=300843 RepID=A0AAW2MV01_SESRA
MAYNLESLVKILEQILHHPDHHKPIWILDPDKKPLLESLLEKARSLRNFFGNSSSAVSTVDGIRDLERLVGAAAQDAEDILEFHLTDQILSAPGGKGFTLSPPNLPELNTRLDSAVEDMRKIMSKIRMAKAQDQGPKTVVVGISEDVDKLLDWLTISQDSKALKIIPIVGMGGIDDVWDTKPWDDARRYFPDDGNDSRIVVTTRETKVANYTSSVDSHHHMNLLKDDSSWKLLHQKVFAPQETCTPELEEVGKRIANNCRGLPLAINVIGGLLSQAKRSPESWEQIAKDVSSAVADEEQFLNILSLSYNNLPYHLKPCFLYMGAFPENYEIRASRLVKLWAAEGFLKRVSDKSPEEAAEIYLKALVDRNLIFIHRQEPKGNVRSYSLHDLLRDLCVRKAHEEKFLLVKEPDGPPRDTLQLRRMSTQDTNISAKQMQHARSFLFTGAASPEILSDVVSEFRLLRVLDILGIKSDQFPEEILQLVNLRTRSVVQKNLLSLSTIAISQLSDKFFETVRNLKELGIICDSPSSPERDLILPHKLKNSNVAPVICRLQTSSCLVSFSIYPQEVDSDDSHFPRLEHLVIRGCSNLEEIPAGIGEITTLEIIEVQHSSASAVASAVKIQEEQADYGVQVRFGPSS